MAAHRCSVRWSRRILSGVTRLTPISLSSARSNAPRTGAPSLHRHYPVSTVLRAPPTPVAPDPRQSRWQAVPPDRQASRVANPRLHTCCAHYPGEPIDLHLSVRPVDRSGLRPWRGDSALASDFSRLARASSRCGPYACWPADAGFVPGASTARSPLPSSGLLLRCTDTSLRPDSRRLRELTLHGTLSTISPRLRSIHEDTRGLERRTRTA
jgi:hypothetical protein